MENSPQSEKLLLSFGALVIVGVLVLFFNEGLLEKILGNKQENTGTPIGRVTNADRDVRRKTVSNLAWENLSGTEQVYEGDSIYTGEASKATITIDGSSDLEVAPNSLVVLEKNEGQLNMDVQYGNFSGRLAANQVLRVKMNGVSSELRGGAKASSLKVRADGQVLVLDGEARLNGKTVKANEKIDISTGKISDSLGDAQQLEIELQEPVDGFITFKKSEDVLKFSWSGAQEDPSLIVEVAKDVAFKNIVWRSAYAKNGVMESAAVPAIGPVYWRVKSTAMNTTSNLRRMGLFANGPVAIVEPAISQNFNLNYNEGANKKVRMTWKDLAPAEGYNLEIAKDKGFQESMVRGHVRTTSVLSPALPVGEYFWRVQPVHQKRPDAPWTVGHFKVSSTDKPPMPELIVPDVSVKLEAKVDDIEAFKALPAEEQQEVLKENIITPVELKWRPVNRVKGYKIEVASAEDKTFAAPVMSEEVSGSEYQWEEPRPGVYQWRVSAISPVGQPGEPSRTGKISVGIEAPKHFIQTRIRDRAPTSSELSLPPKEVPLGWNPVVYAEKYEVEVAENEKFENPRRLIATTTETKVVPRKFGESVFRVRALDKESKPLSAFSAPQVFSYERVLELDSPKMVNPKANASVVMIGNSESEILLVWSSVRGGSRYQYQVAQDAEFTKLIQHGEIKGQRVLVTKNLREGKYFWRVRALGIQDNVNSLWQGPAQFSINSIGSSTSAPNAQ